MNAIDNDEGRRQVTQKRRRMRRRGRRRPHGGGRHPLLVTVSSRHPSTFYNQSIDQADDGTVHLPAPDDGFKSVGAEGTTAGTATSTEDAVGSSPLRGAAQGC